MLQLPGYSETVFYFLGILIISICVTLFFLLIKNLTKEKSKWDKTVAKLPKDFIEDESYEKALRILDEARLKSLQIVAESKVFDEKTKEEIKKRLELISQRQLKSLEDVSGELLNRYTDLLSDEVENFKESLHETTVESQKRVDSQVRSEYSEIKKEIFEYKTKKIEEIDKAIYIILSQVMADLFGKMLSMKEHEDLIIKLLEDAKTRIKFEV